MNSSKGLQDCYEALERLKNGCPRMSDFSGIELSQITNSIVSQEAGHDKGYIKNKRESHQGIVQAIKDAKKLSESSTLSKSEITKRYNKKIKSIKERLTLTEEALEKALSREIVLLARLQELENDLNRLNNVTAMRQK